MKPQKNKNLFLPYKAILSSLFTTVLLYSTVAVAAPDIKLLHTKNQADVSITKIKQLVLKNIDINLYREVKTQVIFNQKDQADYVLVYLFSKKYHQVEISRINIDKNFQAISIVSHYNISKYDYAQQPGIKANEAICPDPSIEFIAFAPNDIDLEQNITIDVANAAESHSLKTIRLLLKDATRENYLNYMSCPNLKGNFYDGDANPQIITTVDGMISYEDIEISLRNKFRFKVTNIWLACQAYNDPIKTSVMDIAQSQKYAAGINNLRVGPSDEAAACTMKEGFDGKPLKASFEACYAKLDIEGDKWGFGGNGSDYFGM